MEEIMKGTQIYRNHKLVNIFDKLRLIENFGIGILRTFDAYKDEKRRPIFEATENFFYVTLPNLNYLDDDRINELDLKILNIIYINPGIKVLAIQERLSASDVQVTENQIRNLIKRKIYDYIEYKGSKKAGGYYMKD